MIHELEGDTVCIRRPPDKETKTEKKIGVQV